MIEKIYILTDMGSNPKYEILNSKQYRMTENQNSKRYDLEERTLNYARRTIEFVNELPKTLTNNEVIKQLVRSAGSVGANYIEANESLSKKDFIMRVKICRKEAKETLCSSVYLWIRFNRTFKTYVGIIGETMF